MNVLNNFVTAATTLAPTLGTVAAVVGILTGMNWLLKRRWKDNADLQFRFQLIMLALTFAGMLAIILALPVNDATRGQLLSLIGILLSAAIALSSTTFIGNIMAGIMLKVVRSARPGDFITVAELTGRITEMGLLHTEVQTEFRDLVTVPNMYMVTQPMQVVRASGTILTAEVSLGYDISHSSASKILCEAATHAGLRDAFVHVRQLGDFSVTYRIAGLLEDVKSLISARSRLREAMLDALHANDIEVVSPNFMNTRSVADDKHFIPEPSREATHKQQTVAEDVVFDKAEEAASVEQMRKSIELIDSQLLAIEDDESDAAESARAKLETQNSKLGERLKIAEQHQKDAEFAEQTANRE